MSHNGTQKRIVVKVGTSVLTGGTPRLDRAHMVEMVRQCAVLHREGHDVIIVTSGGDRGRSRTAAIIRICRPP